MGRPGTTPVKPKATKPTGRPGGARPHVLSDEEIDSLIATEAELPQVEPKPVDPLAEQGAIEFQTQADSIPPAEVTLQMLDAAYELYILEVMKHRRLASNHPDYWKVKDDMDLRNSKLINLIIHYRAHQDQLMREALDRNTQAMLKQ